MPARKRGAPAEALVIGRMEIRMTKVRTSKSRLMLEASLIAKMKSEKPSKFPELRIEIPLPRLPEVDEEHRCRSCDTVIHRVEFDLYWHTGRCSPCHDALDGK